MVFCLSVIWAFSEISVKLLLDWQCLVMNLILKTEFTRGAKSIDFCVLMMSLFVPD